MAAKLLAKWNRLMNCLYVRLYWKYIHLHGSKKRRLFVCILHSWLFSISCICWLSRYLIFLSPLCCCIPIYFLIRIFYTVPSKLFFRSREASLITHTEVTIRRRPVFDAKGVQRYAYRIKNIQNQLSNIEVDKICAVFMPINCLFIMTDICQFILLTSHSFILGRHRVFS